MSLTVTLDLSDKDDAFFAQTVQWIGGPQTRHYCEMGYPRIHELLTDSERLHRLSYIDEWRICAFLSNIRLDNETKVLTADVAPFGREGELLKECFDLLKLAPRAIIMQPGPEQRLHILNFDFIKRN